MQPSLPEELFSFWLPVAPKKGLMTKEGSGFCTRRGDAESFAIPAPASLNKLASA